MEYGSMSDEISRWERYHAEKEGRPTIIGRFFTDQYTHLLNKVLDDLNLAKDSSILDVGCGSCRFLYFFRERGYYNSIGIDLSRSGLKNAYRDYGYVQGKDVFLMDALKTSFPSKHFDLVFSEGILEHFTDYRPCIYEMCRISRRNIIVVQPNFSSILRWIAKIVWELFYRNLGGVREYPYLLREFVTVFEYCGFDVRKNYFTLLRENAIMVFQRYKNEKS